MVDFHPSHQKDINISLPLWPPRKKNLDIKMESIKLKVDIAKNDGNKIRNTKKKFFLEKLPKELMAEVYFYQDDFRIEV